MVVHFTQSMAARNKVFSCDDGQGHRVFQDVPCSRNLKPWERDLTDRTRWTPAVQSGDGCSVRSPTVGLTWPRADQAVHFEGGVALLLHASESGVAASIVVEAAWPSNALQTERSLGSATEVFGALSAAELARTNPPVPNSSDPRDSPTTAPTEGPAPPIASPQQLAGATAKRLELSGNIAGHAIVPDSQEAFVVDSMDDPTHMRYGYRQTSNLLRAFKKAATIKFHLTLRSPEVEVISDTLELNGLEKALSSVTRCADRKSR